ncbi:MAG: hypothetical protein MJZ31_06820 [Bacteroidales bacterium]|nr:hypothetical protein [Bacteroidales bacterium]
MAVRILKKKTATKTTTTKKAVVKRTDTTKTRTIKKATPKAETVKTKIGTIVRKDNAVSATGNKKIATLQKEFNKAFPYLRLGIFYSYARQQVAKGESITQIDGDKTLASVRRAGSGGDISVAGNKKIASLEAEFDKVFGLYAQICYTSKEGNRYYTSGASDQKTLAAFNRECEANGCKKGVWR